MIRTFQNVCVSSESKERRKDTLVRSHSVALIRCSGASRRRGVRVARRERGVGPKRPHARRDLRSNSSVLTSWVEKESRKFTVLNEILNQRTKASRRAGRGSERCKGTGRQRSLCTGVRSRQCRIASVSRCRSTRTTSVPPWTHAKLHLRPILIPRREGEFIFQEPRVIESF